jgi:hypothetical protein
MVNRKLKQPPLLVLLVKRDLPDLSVELVMYPGTGEDEA